MSKVIKPIFAERHTVAALILAGVLIIAGCAAPATDSANGGLKTPSIAVNLPPEHNTPDGMTLDSQNNILLACPNFNDPTHAAWIMKITPDDELEEFFELPVHP